MARIKYSTVKMKRSNVPGKVPTDPSTVDYGELLVNYAEGKEFVATKNSKNEFVKFEAHPDASGVTFNGEHSDTVFTGKTVGDSIVQIEDVILDDEQAIAASLNDLDDRINILNEIEYTGEVNVDAEPGTPSGNVTIVNDNASKYSHLIFQELKEKPVHRVRKA